MVQILAPLLLPIYQWLGRYIPLLFPHKSISAIWIYFFHSLTSYLLPLGELEKFTSKCMRTFKSGVGFRVCINHQLPYILKVSVHPTTRSKIPLLRAFINGSYSYDYLVDNKKVLNYMSSKWNSWSWTLNLLKSLPALSKLIVFFRSIYNTQKIVYAAMLFFKHDLQH